MYWYFFAPILFLSSCNSSLLQLAGTSEQFVITSQIVKDDFTIYVYLPVDYDENAAYPLIVSMDGDNEFEAVSEVVEELIQEKAIPKSIFIAVGYGSEEANDAKRNRDYTPTATEGIEDYETGGAANFYQFLVQELLPKIQAQYAIDNNSKATLIGHSYGGLFTVFAMFQNPETNPFDKFIPVATSYWYDSGILFEYEQQFAANYQDLDAKVYTTMGALEGGVMIASFAEMMQILEDRNYPNLVLYHELLKRYGHSRSDYITFEKGLPYVFNK